jgi:hypothetical protein
MKTAGSEQKVFAPGFPGFLHELREERDASESGLVVGLYALLRAAGMRIVYNEVDVLSAQALQFHYSYSQPECTGLSFVPPVETLFRPLGIQWKEVTPSGPRTAFGVVKEWIDDETIALARLKEPLLIYGYEETNVETLLLAARLDHHFREEVISVSQCDKHFWRYPFDEANLLIKVEGAPTSAPDLTALSRVAAHRAASAWHASELAGCATGADAYEAFSRDLKDISIDFTADKGKAWMGRCLWSQWTARGSSQHFFDRHAPRFGGEERAAATKAGFSYGQCVDAWQRFERLLGPTWDYKRRGFMEEYPLDYLNRWADIELRNRAARWVDEAAVWEAKAVGELVKLIR